MFNLAFKFTTHSNVPFILYLHMHKYIYTHIYIKANKESDFFLMIHNLRAIFESCNAKNSLF